MNQIGEEAGDMVALVDSFEVGMVLLVGNVMVVSVENLIFGYFLNFGFPEADHN